VPDARALCHTAERQAPSAGEVAAGRAPPPAKNVDGFKAQTKAQPYTRPVCGSPFSATGVSGGRAPQALLKEPVARAFSVDRPVVRCGFSTRRRYRIANSRTTTSQIQLNCARTLEPSHELSDRCFGPPRPQG
jgi:hypothetical protein